MVVASVVALFTGGLAARLIFIERATALDFSDRRLLATLAIEAALVLLWIPYLRRRGWRLAHITRPLELRDALRGAGLVILAYLAAGATNALTEALAPNVAASVRATTPSGAPSIPLVIAVALLNPVVEELLYLGYVANVLRRYGTLIAFVAIVALRVVLHFYQGVLAFVGILPVAIVFSVYYLRTERIWPVIAAHTMMDALSLGLLSTAA